MFHGDAAHTGVAAGSGAVDRLTGPVVRWSHAVIPPPEGDDLIALRWYSSFPLGDLDGDGTLEVVVTSPDNSEVTGELLVLKDTPGQDPPVQVLWEVQFDGLTDDDGVDQYSAALADADGDGVLDVIYTSKDGWVRALRGRDGAVLWSYETGRFIEAGPVVADLDANGTEEIVIPTDCELGDGCPGSTLGGAMLVVSARSDGDVNAPLWTREYECKLDSAEPALVDLDPDDASDGLAIVFGSWCGDLHVLATDASGELVESRYDLQQLDPTIHHGAPTVMRSTPMVADFGDGPTAVFGWMPDWTIGTEARISAVRLEADAASGQVQFAPQWTVTRDDWKSSVALLPTADGPRVVTGYGIGTLSGTGSYGACDPAMGGIVSLDRDGEVAWEDEFEDEGNVRGSPAVADLDGDGVLDVVMGLGCYGDLRAWDGETGAIEWSLPLGPRTIASPSIGDLDGDGSLEVVIASYDGQVYAVGAD
jgi:outer membrane protein assembly factor BamB